MAATGRRSKFTTFFLFLSERLTDAPQSVGSKPDGVVRVSHSRRPKLEGNPPQ